MTQSASYEETQGGSVLIIVMGVSGTGKSTLGNVLAESLGMPYVEGDDLHPKSNIEKMSSGQPLNDADREPWLELIRTTAEHKIVEQQSTAKKSSEGSPSCHGVVVTCSSLKKYYREILRGQRKPASREKKISEHLEPADPSVFPTYFVFIEGSRETLLDRMEKRPGHYMKAGMLDSQLNTLESPIGETGVVVVSAKDSTEVQMEKAKEQLAKIAGPYFKEYLFQGREEVNV